jgi:hypothetical protein
MARGRIAMVKTDQVGQTALVLFYFCSGALFTCGLLQLLGVAHSGSAFNVVWITISATLLVTGGARAMITLKAQEEQDRQMEEGVETPG